MERNLTTYFLILFLFSLSSCKKENSVSSEDIIAESLIGSWKTEYVNGYGLLVINKNHTFLIKTYYISSTKNEQLIEIDEGTFHVMNDHFVITDARMTYFSDIEGENMTESYTYLQPENAFVLNDDKLEFSPIQQFKPLMDNKPGSIFGKWKCDNAFFLIYTTEFDDKFKTGKYTQFIELPSNTSSYYMQGLIQFETTERYSPLFKNSYSFINNIFSVNEFTFIAKVSFSEDKMLWETKPIKYTKQ